MRFWEFLLTAVIAELTPGPNMGYLVALSLARGQRAGLAAVAGVALGLALLGLAAAFESQPTAAFRDLPVAQARLVDGGVAALHLDAPLVAVSP